MQKIVFISIPKCGTYLLLRYFNFAGFRHVGSFDQIINRSATCDTINDLDFGDYIAWHFPWNERVVRHIATNGAKVFLLYRDPRAQVCSNMHYVLHHEAHPLHVLFTERLQTNHERLLRLIKGLSDEELRVFVDPIRSWDIPRTEDGKGPLSEHRGSVNNLYRQYARWMDEPFVFPVRFEDIIGPEGGGDRERQLSVLRELMAFTGVGEEAPEPETLAGMLFSREAITFRTGQIDSWKKEFTPELYEIFLEESRELLELWGYDPDDGPLGWPRPAAPTVTGGEA